MHNASPSILSKAVEKILPVLVGPALTALLMLISLYFTVGTLANRVSALEDNSVRKDVIAAEVAPIKSDIKDIKENVTGLRGDFTKYIIEKNH